ncbi:MAG TPA: hypothetical protein VGT61_03085 [Thermomicrobiales bacterium]|jgi:2-desacetyl-2-hydroxyethyl bacteriochlorophyllide A dehydrogenase|nr:hypothetical protein [Thermomicrobiales bacterium]
MTTRKIVFNAPRQAELVSIADPATDLGPDEVLVRTLVSLVSPGTEGAAFQGLRMPGGADRTYPDHPGYANVGEVIAAGEGSGFAVGQRVFTMAQHVSHFRLNTRTQLCVAVPDGVAPRHAAFVRLAMVSMATLRTTTARLGDRAAVVGLGLVGNLAAQLCQIGGMSTLAIDLIGWRCDLARQCGIQGVVQSPGDDVLTRDYQLVIEATGTVGGAMTGTKLVQRHGELSLVGAQWGEGTQTVDTLRLLGTIFEQYIHIRSGWEWQLPTLDTPFGPSSVAHNARAILEWIADNRLVLDPLISMDADPRDAQATYERIVTDRESVLGVLWDWTRLEG